jgi:hypothetical protein
VSNSHPARSSESLHINVGKGYCATAIDRSGGLVMNGLVRIAETLAASLLILAGLAGIVITVFDIYGVQRPLVNKAHKSIQTLVYGT